MACDRLCAAADQKGEMVVVPVLVHLIHEISAVRLKYPQDLRPLDNRMIVLKTIKVRTEPRARPALRDVLRFLDQISIA